MTVTFRLMRASGQQGPQTQFELDGHDAHPRKLKIWARQWATGQFNCDESDLVTVSYKDIEGKDVGLEVTL